MIYVHIKLTWSEYQTFISSFLPRTLDSNVFCDVTLACDDDSFVEAHRVIISAGSRFFESVLIKMRGNPHPFIYLRSFNIYV